MTGKIIKTLIFCMLAVCFALTAANAQSGRRIKNSSPAPDSPPPSVQATQDPADIAAQDAVGYSESSPSAPRLISARPEKDKRSKKETAKKTDAKPAPPAGTTPTAAEDEDIVKVETNLITLPVSVYNRNGIFISDLEQHNFQIFENGAPQEIAYFGTTEKPFSVVLLIDVSPSTAYKIEEIQAAASSFVSKLKPQDKVLVISFDSSVHVLTEMTDDRDKIYKAIKHASFGESTALYEAVDFSIRKRLNKIEGRKAVVLFTDGVDTSSVSASFESTVRDAEESESVIFPIYYNTFLNSLGIGGNGGVMSSPQILNLPGAGGQSTGSSSAEYARGRAYLDELAAATGGKVYRPESVVGGLSAAFESIAEELGLQYSIGYYPANSGTTGERRQIKIRVNRPKLVIRTRDSYIVGANGR